MIKALFRTEFVFTNYKRFKALQYFSLARPIESAKYVHQLLKAINYSLLLPRDMNILVEVIRNLQSNNVPGALVECGVYKGGSAAMSIRTSLQGHGPRHLYLYDSFQGISRPLAEDKVGEGRKLKKGVAKTNTKFVLDVLNKFGISQHQYTIHEGWFSKKLFQTKPSPAKIALLHIDCDLYKPHLICLEALFNRVSVNGAIVFDDYSYLPGVRSAIQDFCKANNISVVLPKPKFDLPLVCHNKVFATK